VTPSEGGVGGVAVVSFGAVLHTTPWWRSPQFLHGCTHVDLQLSVLWPSVRQLKQPSDDSRIFLLSSTESGHLIGEWVAAGRWNGHKGGYFFFCFWLPPLGPCWEAWPSACCYTRAPWRRRQDFWWVCSLRGIPLRDSVSSQVEK